jgi:hypothetical protein
VRSEGALEGSLALLRVTKKKKKEKEKKKTNTWSEAHTCASRVRLKAASLCSE